MMKTHKGVKKAELKLNRAQPFKLVRSHGQALICPQLDRRKLSPIELKPRLGRSSSQVVEGLLITTIQVEEFIKV